MRARLVNETFREKSDPVRDMGIGIHFEDSSEAGRYVKDHLKEITGFSEMKTDPNDEEMFHPRLIKKLENWYEQNKSVIGDENPEDFWDAFVDWEASRFG